MKLILFALLFLEISTAFQGIDVSTWQSYIDWNAVAKNNHFAIIRAGYGTGGVDDYFETNYKNAKAAGVKLGAYWYSYASSTNDAALEAKAILRLLKGKKFEWPIYYDIEESSIFSSGITNSIAMTFCRALEAAHYYCGIYASASALNSYFNSEVKTAFTIWVAHWDTDAPAYHGDYALWQYKVGYTSGVSGQCDLDYGYIDFEPVMKANHLNGY